MNKHIYLGALMTCLFSFSFAGTADASGLYRTSIPDNVKDCKASNACFSRALTTCAPAKIRKNGVVWDLGLTKLRMYAEIEIHGKNEEHENTCDFTIAPYKYTMSYTAGYLDMKKADGISPLRARRELREMTQEMTKEGRAHVMSCSGTASEIGSLVKTFNKDPLTYMTEYPSFFCIDLADYDITFLR